MASSWTVRGDVDYHFSTGKRITELPCAIYKLMANPQTGELYLTRIQDTFPLPVKIYDLDAATIHQVTTYYRSHLMTRNLGVLLSGVKGSGKTITAKTLCNTLGLPVILITTAYGGLSSFFNDIQQDLLIFADEYEKVFVKPHESELLTLMDGALDNGYKRVFLLTVNGLHVSQNLIERPGRIRYHKKYVDMTADAIHLVLDDMLVDRALYDETYRFITELRTITIDIIKSVIDEVNLFHVSPFTFANLFKVNFAVPLYNVYDVTVPEDRKLAEAYVALSHTFGRDRVGNSVRINGKGYYIRRVIDPSTIVVNDGNQGSLLTFEYVAQPRVHSSFADPTKVVPLCVPLAPTTLNSSYGQDWGQ